MVTSFGGNDGLRDIAIQGDGKIVAAGFGGTPRAFALGRFLPADGSLDPSFDGDGGSGNGKVMTFLTTGTVFASDLGIAIDADAGSDQDFGIARFNPGDGTLDTSFACDGTTTTPTAPAGNVDFASGLAVQTDGKIVAAGLAEETAGSGRERRFRARSLRAGIGVMPDDGAGDDYALQPFPSACDLRRQAGDYQRHRRR